MSRLQSVLATALFLTLGASLVFLPSFSIGITGLYNEKRIAQGLVFFIGALFFYLLLFKHQLQIGKKDILLWSILLTLLIISTFFSLNPGWALLEIGWYISLIQLSLVLAYLYQQNPARFERLFLFTIIFMCALYSIRVLGDITTSLIREDWPVWPHRSRFSVVMGGESIAPEGFLGFDNFRFLNHLQTWTLPLLAYTYICAEKRVGRNIKLLAGILLSIWFMIAFASGARGTLISVILGLVAVSLIFDVKYYKRWATVLVSASVIGLIIYFVVFHLLLTGSGKPLARSDSSSRLDWWLLCLQIIRENPVLGLGPMHLANLKTANPITSPHNTYLMWASEWGLPALLLFFYIIYENLKRWIKRVVVLPSVKVVALSSALFAGILHAGISGIMITPLSQLLFTAILGWITGIYFSLNRRNLFKTVESRSRYVAVAAVLVITLFTFYKFTSDIPRLKINQEKFSRLFRSNEIHIFPDYNTTVYPRFWSQGFIGLEDE